jgi:hypothetical protein
LLDPGELDRVVLALVRADRPDVAGGVEQFGLFTTRLAHAGPAAPDAVTGAVLSGPGLPAAREARRINGVLAAVRGMAVHAVAVGDASWDLVPPLCEVAGDRDLPDEARAGDGRMSRQSRVGVGIRQRVGQTSAWEIIYYVKPLPGLPQVRTRHVLMGAP